MILDRESAKNGPHLDEARQLFIVHQPLWDTIVDTLYDRGLHLSVIPFGGDDEPPTYMFTPTQEQMGGGRA